MKITKQHRILCALSNACKLPALGSEISGYTQEELVWAENNVPEVIIRKIKLPLFVLSGTGEGYRTGHEDGYMGDRYWDGSGSGYGVDGYGIGDRTGCGSGYMGDRFWGGAGYGYWDGSGDGLKLFEKAIL